MSGFIRLGDLSRGHDGYPPTPVIDGCTSAVFVNGRPVALAGALFDAHSKPKSPTHEGDHRRAVNARGTIYIEGKLVIKTGDQIADGDIVGSGSADVRCYEGRDGSSNGSSAIAGVGVAGEMLAGNG